MIFASQTTNVHEGKTEGNGLFNDALDTFYLRLYGVGVDGGRKEVFYLTMHSTHLVTVIWRRTYGKGPFR